MWLEVLGLRFACHQVFHCGLILLAYECAFFKNPQLAPENLCHGVSLLLLLVINHVTVFDFFSRGILGFLFCRWHILGREVRWIDRCARLLPEADLVEALQIRLSFRDLLFLMQVIFVFAFEVRLRIPFITLGFPFGIQIHDHHRMSCPAGPGQCFPDHLYDVRHPFGGIKCADRYRRID